jgi:hypothetical protein
VVVIDIGVDYDFGNVDGLALDKSVLGNSQGLASGKPQLCQGLVHKKIIRGTKNIRKGPAMTRQETIIAKARPCDDFSHLVIRFASLPYKTLPHLCIFIFSFS